MSKVTWLDVSVPLWGMRLVVWRRFFWGWRPVWLIDGISGAHGWLGGWGWFWFECDRPGSAAWRAATFGVNERARRQTLARWQPGKPTA